MWILINFHHWVVTTFLIGLRAGQQCAGACLEAYGQWTCRSRMWLRRMRGWLCSVWKTVVSSKSCNVKCSMGLNSVNIFKVVFYNKLLLAKSAHILKQKFIFKSISFIYMHQGLLAEVHLHFLIRVCRDRQAWSWVTSFCILAIQDTFCPLEKQLSVCCVTAVESGMAWCSSVWKVRGWTVLKCNQMIFKHISDIDGVHVNGEKLWFISRLAQHFMNGCNVYN